MAWVYEPPKGYVTVREARERLGISNGTMARRVKSGEIPVRTDLRHKAVKLVAVSDIEKILRLEQPGTGSHDVSGKVEAAA